MIHENFKENREIRITSRLMEPCSFDKVSSYCSHSKKGDYYLFKFISTCFLAILPFNVLLTIYLATM